MKKIIPAALLSTGSLLTLSGYVIFKEVLTNEKKIATAVSQFFTERDAKKAAGRPAETREPGQMELNAQWYDAQKKIKYRLRSDDGVLLNAYLILNENRTNRFIFCSHGYTSSGGGDFGRIAKFWYDLGFNVFLVDHQAHGESEGKLIGFGLRESRDCIRWIELLIKEYGDDIIVGLHGISMGSATVMMMSGAINLPENVKFTVADCGYTTLPELFKHALNDLVHLPTFPLLNVAEAFNRVVNGYKFEDVRPIDRVSRAKIPMMFVHGAEDFLVPVTMCGELYSACPNENKKMLIVDNASHADSYGTNYRLYEEKVSEFVNKVLG